MAGVVAGSVTKSKVLGVVASIPIPEVIRNINSYTLGAQTIVPDVVTKVVWVNGWFDPPKEGEGCARSSIKARMCCCANTDSSAVLQTADKLGKVAFGWDSDMSKFGPKAHLASAIINWAPYYKKAIGDVLAGTWQTGDVVGAQGRRDRSRLIVEQRSSRGGRQGYRDQSWFEGGHVLVLEGPDPRSRR